MLMANQILRTRTARIQETAHCVLLAKPAAPNPQGALSL
jgi:hypothetical protein